MPAHDARNKRRRPSRSTVKAAETANHQVPDLEEARDEGLVGHGRDAHGLQNRRQVVGDDTNAIPLREHAAGDGDEEPVSVTLRSYQVQPRRRPFALPLHPKSV